MTENVLLNWVTKEIKHIAAILPDYFIADYVIRLLTPWGERGGGLGGGGEICFSCDLRNISSYLV